MLNKIHKELNDFASAIKTIKSHDELLGYMNSNFYACIKLLVYASGTFSLYWRVMLIFVITLSGLLISLSIEPIRAQLHSDLNTSYILAILVGLVFFKLVYILHCKKYLISCIKKSKGFMEKTASPEV